MLSMALAKMGSTARWTSICNDLGLPGSHANRIGSLLRYIRRAGHWPDVLASLEQLMTLLQQRPPPIDYQARRADQVDAFTNAIETARRTHRSSRPLALLVRQLWERFTGGDIAYAPQPLRINARSPEYSAFCRELAVRDADLLHVAHRRLQQTLNETGPATWTPSAPDESEWPDATAHFASVDYAGRD